MLLREILRAMARSLSRSATMSAILLLPLRQRLRHRSAMAIWWIRGVFNAGGTSTVTIGGSLQLGHTYQVQVWSYYSNDSGTATTNLSGITTPGGTVTLDAVSLLNQTGQFAIGTFTSNGNPLVFDFTADGGHGFINAVSVRDLTVAPEPSTWAIAAWRSRPARLLRPSQVRFKVTSVSLGKPRPASAGGVFARGDPSRRS